MREPPDPTRHPSLGSVARASVPDRRAGLVIACDDCAMQCTRDLRRLRRELRAAGRRRGTRVTDARRRRGAGGAPARPGRDDPGPAIPARGLSACVSRRPRGPFWRAPVALSGVRRVQPLPTFDELVELAREHGIEHLGVAPADVLSRARDALHERKAAGAPRGHGVHVPQPGPIHRSRSCRRTAPDASSSAPARTCRRHARRGRPVRRERSRGTRGPTTTRRCAKACGSSAGGCATRGTERSCSPTTTRSSTVRSPTSPASAGSARTPTS